MTRLAAELWRVRAFNLRNLTITVVLAVVCGLWCSAPAVDAEDGSEAAFGPTEVHEYASARGESLVVARQSLQTQEDATGLAGALEGAEGGEYAGVWFDDQRGELVVPTVTPDATEAVTEVLASSELEDVATTEPVDQSWDQLEQIQVEVNDELSTLLKSELLLTSVSPSSNSVVLLVPDQASPSTLAKAETAVDRWGGSVEITRLPGPGAGVGNLTCIATNGICSKPLRGGVKIGTGQFPGDCTAAFKAIGRTFGNRFMLTAGHCVPGNPGNWKAETPTEGVRVIGPVEEYNFIPGDWAKLNANGSWWDTNPWPSIVLEPGVNQEEPIEAESASYLGEMVCQNGFQTLRSCGPVTYMNVSGGNGQQHLVGFKGCAEHGDSGASVTAGHVALGILSGRIEPAPACPNMVVLYSDITEATDAMGVTVGPRLGTKPWGETGEAGPVSGTEATLTGIVNPHGILSNAHFIFHEVGSSTLRSTLPGAVGSGYQRIPVALTATELEPLTTYAYYLVAENAAGSFESFERTFSTPAAPPLVTGVRTDAGKQSMTLHATINGRKSPTHYRFEYGPTPSYGSSIPIPDQELGAGLSEVAQTVSGIEGTFHYRVVATNAGGTTASPDQEVYVQERPFVTTEPAATKIGTKVTLQGVVDPRGAESTFYFEYGQTAAYGTSTPVQSAGAGKGPVAVNASVIGLEFGSNYHYRLVASNWVGARVGGDRVVTPGWGAYAIANPDGIKGAGEFTQVACSSLTSCVAVGSEQRELAPLEHPHFPLAARWDGNEWTPELLPTPSEAKETYLLSDSCPAGTVSCEAVGYYVGPTNGYQTVAERWNGSKWELQPTVNPEGKLFNLLSSVSCPAQNLCQAVGSAIPSGFHVEPIAQRWDGSKWELQFLPTVPGSTVSQIGSISCPSTTFCMAEGVYSGGDEGAGLFANRWNGTTWSVEKILPNPPNSLHGSFGGLSCSSASSCVVLVGEYAERWNGSSWEVQSLPNPTGTIYELSWSSIACTASTSCEAVGSYSEGQAKPKVALAARWNGSKWELQVLPAPPHTWATVLTGIACRGPTTCLASGHFEESRGEEVPVQSGLVDAYIKFPPATAATEPATAVAQTGATLNGAVNPNESETKYRFEYGLTSSYGTSTTETSIGSGGTTQQVNKPISGLSEGATYHFRIVAANAGGTTYGKDQTFATQSTPLSAMATTDPFNGTASPISNFAANWTALPWSSTLYPKGEDRSSGWSPVAAFPNVAGASYGPTVTDLGSGMAVAATLAAGPGLLERYFSLWLDAPGSLTNQTGYQLKFVDTALNKYTVSLIKWNGGTQATLKEVANYGFVSGNSFALVDVGGTVSAWTNTGSGFTQLLSSPDSTFSTGTAAVEGSGNATLLRNFKFGALQAKAASMPGALGELTLRDGFAKAEFPLSEGGVWKASAFVDNQNTGQVSFGWGPYEAFETTHATNGAYWTPATFADTGSGDAVAATLYQNPTIAERHFELFLDMPTPATVRSGYELRFTETAANRYSVVLTKSIGGAQTVLASQSSVSLAVGNKFALADRGGTVSAWTAPINGAFTQLLSASDSTFTSGYAGLAGGGNITRLKEFRAGPLAPF